MKKIYWLVLISLIFTLVYYIWFFLANNSWNTDKKIDFSRKIIFVHGYNGSSKTDWFPKIAEKLDALEINYAIPDLPGNLHPQSQEWIKIIQREIKLSDKPVILVGYSLGTRAILLYLEKYKTKVSGVILIAPLGNDAKNANRENGTAYPDFFQYKIDLSEISKLNQKFVIIHSKDDSTIDYYENGLPLAKKLGAQLITYKNKGHFNSPSNASEILKILRRELNF